MLMPFLPSGLDTGARLKALITILSAWGFGRKVASGCIQSAWIMSLSLVPAPDEQLDRPAQSADALREAARAARQPRQVVPELGIVALDRVGLALVIHGPVLAPVAQLAVGVE